MTTQRVFTPEEAKKRLEMLPEQTQELLYSPEMMNILAEVGKAHGLHVDQLGLLQAEVTAVMLGFTETQDFASLIAENVHIEETEAQKIAEEVSDKLFSKIRESMKGTPPSPAPMSAPAAVANPPQATPKAVEAHPADLLLTQKTVTVASSVPPVEEKKPPIDPKAAPATPPAPQPYKIDPYREPTE